jgi:hypothetical protein
LRAATSPPPTTTQRLPLTTRLTGSSSMFSPIRMT